MVLSVGDPASRDIHRTLGARDRLMRPKRKILSNYGIRQPK